MFRNGPIVKMIRQQFRKKTAKRLSSTHNSLSKRDMTVNDFIEDREVLFGMLITVLIISILYYYSSSIVIYDIIKTTLSRLFNLNFGIWILQTIKTTLSATLFMLNIPSGAIQLWFLGMINKFFYHIICKPHHFTSGLSTTVICTASNVGNLIFDKCLKIIWFFSKLMYFLATDQKKFVEMLRPINLVDVKSLHAFFKSIYRYSWGILCTSLSPLLLPLAAKLPLFNSQYIEFDEKGTMQPRYLYKKGEKYYLSEHLDKEYIMYIDGYEITFSNSGTEIERYAVVNNGNDVWKFDDPESPIKQFKRSWSTDVKCEDTFVLRPPKEDLSFVDKIIGFMGDFEGGDQKKTMETEEAERTAMNKFWRSSSASRRRVPSSSRDL